MSDGSALVGRRTSLAQTSAEAVEEGGGMVRTNMRAVEELVADDLCGSIETTLNGQLASAVKERMAWEDVVAIGEALIDEVIAPYVLKVAESPHRVMLAALSSEAPSRPGSEADTEEEA